MMPNTMSGELAKGSPSDLGSEIHTKFHFFFEEEKNAKSIEIPKYCFTRIIHQICAISSVQLF